MRTEIISGLNLGHIAAGILHLAVLWAIQRGLDRLAITLRVDRLSLVNDRSTKTAVVRGRLPGLTFGYGDVVCTPSSPGTSMGSSPPTRTRLGNACSTGRNPAGDHYPGSQLLGRQADLRHEPATACFSSRRLLPLGKRPRRSMRGLAADRDPVGCYDVRARSSRSPVLLAANSRDIINTLVILATGYLACRQVNLAADKIIQSHRVRGGVDVRSRALYTEVSALRKAILFVLAFLTVATAMIFCAPLRHLGTSLLASAGLITVLAGVVVQRSLGNLFAGFQLALTEPILLDDLVVVEGELGKVEEIALAYVVVHLWDQRRLVVPISYFLEKPFENWTRRSPELLGTVFLYFDYHLPINELREEFFRYVEAHPAWDKRTSPW